MAGGLLRGAWYIDLKLGSCVWSASVRQILELPEDVLAQPWPECAQLFSTALSESLPEFWPRVLQGEPYSCSTNLASGRAIDFEAEPILEDGEVVRVIGTVAAKDASLSDLTAFKIIADSAPAGIFLVDADANCLYTNSEWQQLMLMSPSDALGRGWTKAIEPNELPRIFSRWEEVVADGGKFVGEFMMIRSDGTRFPGRVRSSQIHAGAGMLGYVGILEDITAENRAHQELLASEGLFRTLADTVPAHVWILGRNLQPLYWNKTLLDYTGLSDDQVRSRGTMTAVHEEDLGPSLDVLRQARREKRGFELRQRLRGADGEYRWFLVRGVSVLDEKGSMDRLVGISTDIQDTIELSEERKRLFSILEATGDLVSIATPDGQVRYLNPAGRKMLGIGDEEPLDDLHVKDTRPQWAAELLSNVGVPYAAETGCWIGETAFLSRDGREIPTSQAVLVHKNSAGKIDYFSTVARDISDQKRIEAELASARDEAMAATRAKSMFLANMSHEIRTPLNGIIGLTSLLARKLEDQGDRQLATALQSSGEGLLRIINDILDFSKVEAGKMSLERHPTELAQLVQDVAALFKAHAEERHLDLRVEVPQDQCWVEADALRLRQILSNLVSNAIKFTNAGHVTLRLKTQSDGPLVHTVLEVEDTGVGIPDQLTETIFDSFSQADASIARTHGGTGLGLSICLGLTQLMGGEMSCKSQLGRGTTFTVKLDLVAAPVVKVVETADISDTQGLRVLVAEDNDVNQLVASQVLADLGCTAVIVDNGMAAIKAALTQPFDLILMDIHMPLCDGLEATKAIRHQEQSPRVPIVALTANADEESRKEYLDAGMDAVVRKPFTFSDLQTAVRDFAIRPIIDRE